MSHYATDSSSEQLILLQLNRMSISVHFLRYEAEIISLRLQLDRCRNELTHYTTEATRLGQQLRLKTQYEDDQYKKHLESRVSVGV